MPTYDDSQPVGAEAHCDFLKEILKAEIHKSGIAPAWRSLRKGRMPRTGPMTVLNGVLEEQPSGRYDAALQTNRGPVVLINAQRGDRSDAPETTNSIPVQLAEMPPTNDLLEQLDRFGINSPSQLICQVELTHFEAASHEKLLANLWKYIQAHKHSGDPDILTAVGSAIRKHVAIMPMDRLGNLADLLDPTHRVSLPLDLELEIAKMVYRNFETLPPKEADPQPALSERLMELAKAYLNPRILLREKYSAVASLAVEALVAMRSAHALEALCMATDCPHRWFGEMIADDLELLRENWAGRSDAAVAWLDEIQSQVVASV